jgi:cytochrome c553
MKKLLLLAVIVLAVTAMGMAQNYSPTMDVLGAHQNNGRGCAGCHAPHSGSRGAGQAGTSDSGGYALWGQDVGPIAGKTLAFGDNGKYVEVLPATLTSGGIEVSGILLCLSCHDGNYTQTNMMTKSSYEQRLGVLPAAYGSQPIPTLLGADGTGITGPNGYNNDHPVGVNATISTGSGLLSTNGVLTVTAGSQYAEFVSNYGWPALAPGKYSSPTGINAALKPFVVCTTCHNQHVMNVYAASANSQIAGASTGYYQTFFFVNGPYNPGANTLATGGASSTTQFCRQCHFGEANEANNAHGIKTVF